MKYTWKYKLECVTKYNKNENIVFSGTQKQKDSFIRQVRTWAKIYEKFGIDGLQHSLKNKIWTPEERFALVARVLSGNSLREVSLQANINVGQLHQWLKRYSERGMEGLQCKQGRPSKNIMKSKKVKQRANKSLQEELKLLKERNEYLEMENQYLKKLDALVSKREVAEAKAKKRKLLKSC